KTANAQNTTTAKRSVILPPIVVWHLISFRFNEAVCRPQSLTTAAYQANGIRESPGSALCASLLRKRGRKPQLAHHLHSNNSRAPHSHLSAVIGSTLVARRAGR